MLKHFVLSLNTSNGLSSGRPKTSMGHYAVHEAEAEEDGLGVKRSAIEAILCKLRPGVEREWKTMRRELKKEDSSNSSTVNIDTLKQVFMAHNLNLNEHEFFILCDFCDQKVTGMIDYNQLLRLILK